MSQLTVTANRLNKRKFPVLDFKDQNSLAGVVTKGFTFESVSETTNALGKWYRDRDGYYYWHGGIVSNLLQLEWSRRLFGLPQIWQKTRGEGVRVAILDTGIDLRNPDLSNAVVDRFNIMEGSDDVQDEDSHGTCCASVLAARGSGGVTGVAPACDLIVIKIANENSDLSDEKKINGLHKAAELGVDIISMSFGTVRESQSLTQVVRSLMQKGIICLAAAGNSQKNPIHYPANVKGMISVGNVGCLNPDAGGGANDYFISQRSAGGSRDDSHEGITIVAPGCGISAYDNKGKVQFQVDGTSFATPYVAGVAALWLSVQSQRGAAGFDAHTAFRDFIRTTSRKDVANYTEKFWGNGIINPLAILTT